MDLIDIIEEKRFLGQEFLTWLWFKSEERGGTVFLPEAGEDVQVVFEKHMLLEYGEGETQERLTCRGLQTELQEARTGLVMGKKLEQARLHLVRGQYEWHLSLTGSLLEYRNVRPPRTMATADEGNDPEAVEARLLDHMGLFEMAVRTVDEFFRMFVKMRIDRTLWEKELSGMQAWVQKGRQ